MYFHIKASISLTYQRKMLEGKKINILDKNLNLIKQYPEEKVEEEAANLIT